MVKAQDVAQPIPLDGSSSGSEQQRQAVVVLAMHRTGSSALTRTLVLLGCDNAKTLIGANEHNQSGYWESDVLRVFNDKLLASGGSNWRDWQTFHPGWYHSPRFDEYLARGQDLLKAEYGASRFFVMKDPRMPRIFPFWKALMAQAGITPHILLTLRHPAEVAASLARRDKMPAAEAALLWLRYTLEGEYCSRGLARAVIHYDRLIAAPCATLRAAQAPLGLVWPRLSDSVCEEIDAFMSPDLRHHKVEAREVTGMVFNDWLAETFAILLRWSETGEDPADHAVLDRIRSEFDALSKPLRDIVPVLAEQQTSLAAIEQEVRHLRGEAGRRGDALAALKAETEAKDRALAAAENRATELAEAAKAHETARAELEALQQATKAELETLQHAAQAEQETRFEEIAELTRLLVARDTMIDALQTTNGALVQQTEADRHNRQHLSERTHRAIAMLLAKAERPWLGGHRQLRRKVAALMASGLFDAEWYRAANADIGQSKVDPVEHFILFGHREGRPPLPGLGYTPPKSDTASG